jgi:hypothetical protein
VKHVLVLEYSQSGDVTKVADAFSRPLGRAGVEVRRMSIQPVAPYPSPWGNLIRLFSVFPECFVPPANGIRPLDIGPQERFDLVVLSYQVWHLAPSIPIQAFLRSEHAAVLRDTPVITLCVSRNMWNSASETMKALLRNAGAIHLDNVVVTHQGPPLTTFVSVPRALLWGKRDRLWGIFPPADLSARDLERAERLGSVVATRLDDLTLPYKPLLGGQGAVTVKKRYIVAELGGWYFYRGSARLIARLGPPGGRARYCATWLFTLTMLAVIFIAIPLCVVVFSLLYPLLRGKINRYAWQLAQPSG